MLCQVGFTPGVLTASTADLTVSLLLATSRRLMEGSAALRAGDWPAWSPQWLCGPELAGSTVGIVGLGNIGRWESKHFENNRFTTYF